MTNVDNEISKYSLKIHMLCRYMKFLETKQHYKYIYIKNSKETPRLIGKILLQKKKKKKERERERERKDQRHGIIL